MLSNPFPADNGSLETPLDAVMIGAGFSGILAGIRLRQSGFDRFVILEKSAGVGGTWRDNSYPGAGCDIPSHLYSFSFALNPKWSQQYATQPEILSYIEDCTTRYGLRPHLRLQTEVKQADYLPESCLWRVQTASGIEYYARNLLVGVGQLNRPSIPNLPHRDQFQGQAFHSARWPANCDLTGKRVAVLGTGASAVQFIPAIAPQVGSMTILQRTPHWIARRWERKYTEREKARFARWPWWMRLARWGHYMRYEFRVHIARYEPIAEWIIDRLTRGYLEDEIADGELRKKLTPDYQPGCCRVLGSDDYYQSLTRPNVELLAEGAVGFYKDGVITGSGRQIPADVVIYATGFKMQDLAGPFPINGLRGSLQEAWNESPQSHFGITAHGFPNMFHFYGPNTNLTHNSILFMLECQMEYVVQLLRAKRDRGAAAVEVTSEAVRRFQAWLAEDLKKTIWTRPCGRPFQSSTGQIIRNWSRYTIGYWRMTRRLKMSDFAFTNLEKKTNSAASALEHGPASRQAVPVS